MSSHDSKCPRRDGAYPDECWWCPVIIEARADERERNARAIEARRDALVAQGFIGRAVYYSDAAQIVRNGVAR